MASLDEKQKTACLSMGEYYRCAALCYSELTITKHVSGCPYRARVWTLKAMKAEQTRWPNGPLKDMKLGRRK